jgi:hypothetical protein
MLRKSKFTSRSTGRRRGTGCRLLTPTLEIVTRFHIPTHILLMHEVNLIVHHGMA